jgi:acetylglutamate kinase
MTHIYLMNKITNFILSSDYRVIYKRTGYHIFFFLIHNGRKMIYTLLEKVEIPTEFRDGIRDRKST